MVLSRLPSSKRQQGLSGVRQLAHLPLLPSTITPTLRRDSASQRRIELSKDALARVFPSGLKAREVIDAECPLIWARWFPVAISHKQTELSSDAPAMVLPSGLKATVVISPEQPLSLALCLPVAASQR